MTRRRVSTVAIQAGILQKSYYEEKNTSPGFTYADGFSAIGE